MNKKSQYYFAILFLFTILVYWKFFLTTSIFTWGDWGWFFPETVHKWFALPSIWTYSGTGGVDISLTQYLPVRLFYGFLSFFMPFKYFDRIVFIFPSILIGIYSIFHLTKKVTNSSEASAISVLVFTFNSYFLVLRGGHFTLAVAFAIAPLVISLFISLMELPKLKTALICGLLSSLSFAYEPRAFFITANIMLAYLLYYIVYIHPFSKTKPYLIRLIYASIPIVTVLALSLYGFIGFRFASTDISTQILNRSLFGSGQVDIQRAFTLSINAWTENILYSGNSLYIVPYFWLVPFFAFFGLWFGRNNKNILFFGLLGIVGIFLTKQSNQPFNGLYQWMFDHIPGFNIFREPSKFNFLIILSYSVLLGNLLVYLINHFKLNSNRKIIYLFILVISLPFLLNTIPIARGAFGKMLTARNIPNDYLIYKKFLEKDPGSYRVMFVPAASRWAYWDPDIRLISSTLMATGDWESFANYSKVGLEYSHIDHAMSVLEKKDSPKYLNEYSVRYVVVPPEDKQNEEIFIFDWGKRSEFVNRVSKLTFLKPIDIGTSELKIYENPNYKPLIYMSFDSKGNDSSDPVGDVSVKRLSASEFEVYLKDLPASSSSVYLHYGEKYNVGWKLRLNDFSWIKSLLDEKYYFENVVHEKTLVDTNSFKIDLTKIPPGQRMANGNILFHIYFAPQAIVNFASIFSLFCFFIVIALIILKNRHE